MCFTIAFEKWIQYHLFAKMLQECQEITICQWSSILKNLQKSKLTGIHPKFKISFSDFLPHLFWQVKWQKSKVEMWRNEWDIPRNQSCFAIFLLIRHTRGVMGVSFWAHSFRSGLSTRPCWDGCQKVNEWKWVSSRRQISFPKGEWRRGEIPFVLLYPRWYSKIRVYWSPKIFNSIRNKTAT